MGEIGIVRRCSICGAILQTERKEEPGYIDPEILKGKPLDALVSCESCYLENMQALSKNGLVVFIDRHPSHILRSTSLGDRPLVQNDRDKLFRLYADRLALYRRHADVTVPNHGGPRTLKKRLLQILRHYRRAAKP